MILHLGRDVEEERSTIKYKKFVGISEGIQAWKRSQRTALSLNNHTTHSLSQLLLLDVSTPLWNFHIAISLQYPPPSPTWNIQIWCLCNASVSSLPDRWPSPARVLFF